MSYKYKRPEGKLRYISMRKWNKTFGKRGTWPFVTVEAYVTETQVTTQYVYTIWGKLFITLSAPILTLLHGMPETFQDLKRTWRQKHYGSFSRDVTFNTEIGQESWNKLQGLIHSKGTSNE